MIFKYITRRWRAKAGYGEFLKIALPLIISKGAWSFQSFIDKFFLAWYSDNSYAAVFPAGLLNSSVLFIFLGTVSYTSVFVSQYNGKKEYKSIGPVVWQAIYIAVLSSLFILVFPLFSNNIFNFIGHSKDIVQEEIKYFNILCCGSFFYIGSQALSGFYVGREKTKVILFVNLIGIITNIALDYLLIFGNFGFPKLGIEGAAVSTIAGSIAVFTIFFILFLSKKNKTKFNTVKPKPDIKFLKRFTRFSFPNGIHMFLDLSIFTFFSLIVGSLGKLELSATSIVMNIYNLAYMPILGCGAAISIMTGNYLGKNKASMVQKSVITAVHIVLLFIFFILALFLFFPNFLIAPFAKGSEAMIIENIRPTIIVLFKFTSAYCLFESLSVIFSSAIKGAGDTKFVMKLLITLFTAASVCMYIASRYFGLYGCWVTLLIYGIFLSISCYLRYKSGKWKNMRVIKMKVVEG
ncbi:MAG: MATE family efflux transporter [Endomicrobium sp.]|jgi:MATE family multidrug resistance protein|nr:MATE family efflux transporter [Endomicrobium sp.]